MTSKSISGLKTDMPLNVQGGISGEDIYNVLDTFESRSCLSVKQYGAVGDGTTDDTAAIQAAFNSTAPPVVYFPAGRYRVTSPITLPGASFGSSVGAGLRMVGDGEATEILHAFDGVLFTCSVPFATFLEFRDFKIVSTTTKSATSHAFYFGGGLTRSRFANLRLGRDVLANAPAGLFDCAPSSTIDTVMFQECYLEDVKHKGYGIGSGSSVWWDGGRIIGLNRTTPIGIEFYGSNGGLWLWGCDIINLAQGVRVSASNGTSNRELFFVQSCFDSCHIGLWLLDNTYCEIEGVWAASCNQSCILTDSTYNGTLVISGGTVFNAGAFGNNGGTWGNMGVTLNGGYQVKIDGVVFRNNAGIALSCPASTFPGHSTVTNCTFSDNGIALQAGGAMDIIGNQFYNNTTNLVEISTDLIVESNRGINPRGPLVAPAIPASAAEYTYAGSSPVDVYIRGGTVTAVSLNSNPVYTASNCVVRMVKGDRIAITYSVAPNWVWMGR